MPIPQTIRVNPLDLQKNVAIGVSLPFNGPAGPFNKTYSTKDQIKSNLINLLLTNKGERLFNPGFGADINKMLFEGITENTTSIIQNMIVYNASIFVPEITIKEILFNPSYDTNTLSITINYILNISETPDQITIEFL